MVPSSCIPLGRKNRFHTLGKEVSLYKTMGQSAPLASVQAQIQKPKIEKE